MTMSELVKVLESLKTRVAAARDFL